MRDKEFEKEFVRLAPKLETFFVKRIRGQVSMADKMELARELVQETALKALQNARKEKFADRSIETLLFQKADNVWKDHLHARKRQLLELDVIERTAEADENTELMIGYTQALAIIREFSNEKAWKAIKKRSEGFSYSEIAMELGMKEANLRQMISRQVRKIGDKYY